MIIKVLGPGCTNCKNLERVTNEAVTALGIDDSGHPDPCTRVAY